MSVFCKNVDKAATKIIISRNELEMDIRFKDGQAHYSKKTLVNSVNVDGSKFVILSTKIEISLAKIDAVSWTGIE